MEMVSGGTEMSVRLKEEFDYLHFPREGGRPRHAGTQAKHQVLIRRQKQEQGERQGRANRLGPASLDTSCGLWGIGAVLSCLVPGPGLIQGRGTVGLVCEFR